MLEDLLSVKITNLCYPEGKFSRKVIKIATDLGYDKQFSEYLVDMIKSYLKMFKEEV